MPEQNSGFIITLSSISDQCLTLRTFVNTSAAPGEAFRTSHKPANTVIRFLKVHDPPRLLWDVCEERRVGVGTGEEVGDWGRCRDRHRVAVVLGLSSPVDPNALPAVEGTDGVEVSRGREREWDWSVGMRQDLCGDASTVKASSSLFEPELLSANTSN